MRPAPKRIDPGTLTMRLIDTPGPIPAGTGIYDSEGYLIATLGESTPSDDPECDWSALLIPPPDGQASST